MGCDIHLYVEKLNPETKARQVVTAVSFDGSSIALVTGHVPGHPDRLTTIGADVRMAARLAQALEDGEEPVAEYESWQVLA